MVTHARYLGFQYRVHPQGENFTRWFVCLFVEMNNI